MRPLPPNLQPHPTRQHANPTPHQVMLPKGSCVAKGAQLDGDKVAQGKWDSWCDVNCVASKWGGLGGKGGCRDGSETGSVGCVCKQGLTPVSVKTGRPSLTPNPTPNPCPYPCPRPSPSPYPYRYLYRY